MSKPDAQRIIREAAVDSARVFITLHAKKRLRQRKITPLQVVECVLKGAIVEGPTLGLKGGWTCTMERMVAGDRVKVGVVIDDDYDLVVESAM